jgi:WS/DGAT/MGAT family acyltransferase
MVSTTMATNKQAPESDGTAANLDAWSRPSGWGASDRLNELETWMWRSERHPAQSSTICMVMLLDRLPDWERLRAAHDWAARYVPRLRDRVLEPSVPVGTPAWVPDPAFDLDYHLRRVTLPAPGGTTELMEFAQGAAMVPFDRARPLWEGTLVGGLPGGKAAYVLKMHHSLTDGMGTVQLLAALQSRTRRHTPKPSLPEPPARDIPSTGRALAAREAAERLHAAPGLARLLVSGARALSRPASLPARSLRYAGSMRRTMSPPTPGSPLFNGRTGKSWRFGTVECQLTELRAAAKAAGASVNDAFVAALLGGMRRYHERLGVELDELPVTMPFSVRKADDPMGGNRFAGALFAGPMGIADARERMAAVRGIVLSLRVEPALDSFSVVTPLLNRQDGAFPFAARVASPAAASERLRARRAHPDARGAGHLDGPGRLRRARRCDRRRAPRRADAAARPGRHSDPARLAAARPHPALPALRGTAAATRAGRRGRDAARHRARPHVRRPETRRPNHLGGHDRDRRTGRNPSESDRP